MTAAACAIKSSDASSDTQAQTPASGKAGTGTAELADGSGAKVALVPGGAHPYFQPWKTAGAAAKKEYGLGDVTFAETVLAAFGPDRVMYGSDWPVCSVAADYAEVLGAARALTAGLSVDDRVGVFGGTAVRAYRLRVP
ncbi:amidohydrolase family protein [Streptomyces sp. NPDC059866]|uniref:amidohydrolase family protein n=1 Tax=Streptomyces sp. NPDC059866 TaxID=3346978 RepID=UPI0036676FC8